MATTMASPPVDSPRPSDGNEAGLSRPSDGNEVGLPRPSDGNEAGLLRPADGNEAGEVVTGVPMSDDSLALAIRRVIILASAVATYYICGFITNLLMGMYSRSSSDPSELWSGLSQLAIELSIPACGYYGALYGHRTLIFFFCGASLIFIVASAIGVFRLLVVLSSNSKNMCHQEYEQSTSTCEIMLADGPEKYMLLSSMALLTLLGCLSFVAGKRLYQRLHPFDLSSMPSGIDPAPLVGEVIMSGAVLNLGNGMVLIRDGSNRPGGDGEIAVAVEPDSGASGEAPGGEAPGGEAPGGEAPGGEAPGGEAPEELEQPGTTPAPQDRTMPNTATESQQV